MAPGIPRNNESKLQRAKGANSTADAFNTALPDINIETELRQKVVKLQSVAHDTFTVRPWLDPLLANLKDNESRILTGHCLLPKRLSSRVSVENVEVAA